MSLVLFFLLAAVAAGIILYPVLPGRAVSRPVQAVTDGDIERAVHDLCPPASKEGRLCPSCGRAYDAQDRFCVRCGAVLPGRESEAAAVLPTCPSCGAPLRPGDQFCGKCGHHLAAGEVA
jgi:predicted amidophosphoribosyltransferase